MRIIRNAILPIWVLLLMAHTMAAKPTIRHVRGMHGIELNAGIAAVGKALAIDWSYYFSPHWQIKAGLGAETDKFQDNTYSNIFTQPVCVHTLYSNHKNWFFNMLGGARFHLESHQTKKKKELHKSGNIGLVFGSETELFLASKFSILLSGGIRVLLLKNIYGRIDYFLHMGFRMSL